jgi:hypothetical protein
LAESASPQQSFQEKYLKSSQADSSFPAPDFPISSASPVTQITILTQIDFAEEASRFRMAEERRRRVNKVSSRRSQRKSRIRRLNIEQVPMSKNIFIRHNREDKVS